MVDVLEERISLILSELLDPYDLDASLLNEDGCSVFPEEVRCNSMRVVGIYDKNSNSLLAYAGYLVLRGENTLEVRLVKVVNAVTRELLS